MYTDSIGGLIESAVRFNGTMYIDTFVRDGERLFYAFVKCGHTANSAVINSKYNWTSLDKLEAKIKSEMRKTQMNLPVVYTPQASMSC